MVGGKWNVCRKLTSKCIQSQLQDRTRKDKQLNAISTRWLQVSKDKGHRKVYSYTHIGENLAKFTEQEHLQKSHIITSLAQ
jgi:hypothetical protein